jgi:hypothetical protein
MNIIQSVSTGTYDLWETLSIIGIMVGVTVGVIVFISVVTVFTLSRTKLTRLAVPSQKYKKALARGMSKDEWARANGFQFTGFYRVGASSNIFMCIWTNDDASRFFAVYVLPQKTTSDIVTIFDAEGGLTTASTKDGLFFPFPPGSYSQAFSNISMDLRWRKHLESEKFLEYEIGAIRATSPRDFEQTFLRAIRRQMLHIRSIRLWYIKAVYWYLIRRFRLANKSIEEQRDAGLIELGEPVYDVDVM